MTNQHDEVAAMLEENRRRKAIIQTPYCPHSGEGVPLPRTRVHIAEYSSAPILVPNTMMETPVISRIMLLGSMTRYAQSERISLQEAKKRLEVVRCRHDFFYWAWRYVRIKPKDGGDDIPFTLNRPQRRLVEVFEHARLSSMPIRVIVLKARQWGGSTVTQLYMAWLQLMHMRGLNSLIVGHVKTASAEVSSMFDKMMDHYPMELLEKASFDDRTADSDDHSSEKDTPIFALDDGGHAKKNNHGTQAKIAGDRNSRLIRFLPTRNCKIKIGSAETPNSARGGDSALVHCTEVAFWRKTDNKTPEDIIRSACAGASFKPMTMIVYESTANGTGNFFQREYDAAKQGYSQFAPVFVAWWQIERYELAVANPKEFAHWLWEHRHDETQPTPREESGRYLWQLWEMGATLEAINWYRNERLKYADHGDIAAEFPSDDIEAFQCSGSHVFNPYHVEVLRKSCRPPRFTGDISGEAIKGERALEGLHLVEIGQLAIWSFPEIFDDCHVSDRYLVVVDIGGRSAKADWSVICVFDRYWMMEGERPEVCAQWYGHTDMDLLAWKAAQIARYYDNALLVVESNTLETHDDSRWLEGGDQSSYILNEIREVYPNLYARRQSAEDIRIHAPLKYGFHTNVKTKPEIISTMVEAVRENLYIERDQRCLDEMCTYVRRTNGSYGAVEGKHDDLLMTRAIGLHICFHEMPTPRMVSNNATAKNRRDASMSIW